MKLKQTTLLVAGLLLSVPTYAGFDVINAAATEADITSDPAPKARAVRSRAARAPVIAARDVPTLTFSGTQKGTPKTISGMGKHVTLMDALRQIVRFDGWHVFKDKAVNAGMTVSWTGGKPWTVALEDMLNQAGLTGELDWDQKTLLLHNRRQVTLPDAASADDEYDDGEVLTAPKPKRAITSWEAGPDDRTVRTVIEKWAKLAGWQKPFWYPENDYEVSAQVRIDGSFEDALRRVAKNLNLEITVYQGNKIIVVRERN